MTVVSVVVPTCRRPNLLERCLSALVTQSFPHAASEIIIVDDAPDAATRAVVERAAAGARPVRYLATSGKRGPAAARNIGWRAAAGGLIAFTDDDCIPDRDWLLHGVRTCGTDVTGVQGRVVVPRPAVPTDYERTIAWLEDAEFVTANCFCRREALERLGGFDERFTAAWREDSDLYFSLLERGARLVYQPGAVVVHPVRVARWGVSIREQRKTMFNALLFKKHPDLYRKTIQSRPPWRYYAAVTALVVALGSALAGSLPFALAAGAWLGITGTFCRDRLRDTRRSPGHVLEMAVTSAVIPPVSLFWRLYGAVRYRVRFC